MKRWILACVTVAAAHAAGVARATVAPGPPSRAVGVLTRVLSLNLAGAPLVRGRERAVEQSFVVTLPHGARQGGPDWYLLRLRALIVVRASGAGSQLSVSVNGHAGLQLLVQRGRTPHVPVVNELDLLNGETVIPVKRSPLAVDEFNYAQIAGLHGGRNTITVSALAFGREPLLAAVTVLPATGVYKTPVGPAMIDITLPHEVRVPVGQTMGVRLILADSGDDARNARLAVEGEDPAFTVVGPSKESLGTVAAGHPRVLLVRLRGRTLGVGTLHVATASAAGESEGSVRVVVYRREDSTAAAWIAAVFIGGGTAAAVVLVLRRR